MCPMSVYVTTTKHDVSFSFTKNLLWQYTYSQHHNDSIHPWIGSLITSLIHETRDLWIGAWSCVLSRCGCLHVWLNPFFCIKGGFFLIIFRYKNCVSKEMWFIFWMCVLDTTKRVRWWLQKERWEKKDLFVLH